MEPLSRLFQRDWFRTEGASEQAIDQLLSVTYAELPTSYISLLRLSNGGEAPLAVQPYLVILDDAESVAESVDHAEHEQFFPGFIMIGSNGGGEYIAIDTRKSPPWPVVAIDMINSNLDETVLPIAPDFDAFIELLGIDSPDLEQYPEVELD